MKTAKDVLFGVCFGITMFVALILFIGFEWGLVKSFLVGALPAILIGLIGLKIIGIIEAKRMEEAKCEEQRKEEYLQRRAAEGKYTFPFQEFYSACVSAKCTDLQSPFCLQKAKLIADQILEKNGIKPEYHHIYDSTEKLAEYLEEGEKVELDRKERARQEAERIASMPHNADLRNEEKEAIALQNKVADLYGQEKRKFLLQNTISKVEKRIKEIEEGRKAAMELGVMISQSAAQEKTSDWAIAGGIASGIAGPAAGLAVAADTMRRNSEIETRNQANRAAANQLASSVMSSAFNSYSDTNALSAKRDALKEELNQTSTKVILDQIEQSEIIQSVNIADYDIKTTKSNALEISVSIQNTLEIKDVPPNVHLTVDGTFKGEVYAGELLVDTITIPLPLYGVVCGGKKSVTVYCGMYSKNKQPYSLKTQPNKLWVMEE